MAANPYDYGIPGGAFGQRWASLKGTIIGRLNIGRLMSDNLRWWLSQIMDVTSTATFGTWENPQMLGGATGIYTWVDVTNQCERKCIGSPPGSEIDGVITGAGGA